MCDQLLLLPGEIESPIHLAKQSLSASCLRRRVAYSLSGPPSDERNVRGTLAFVPVASVRVRPSRALAGRSFDPAERSSLLSTQPRPQSAGSAIIAHASLFPQDEGKV